MPGSITLGPLVQKPLTEYTVFSFLVMKMCGKPPSCYAMCVQVSCLGLVDSGLSVRICWLRLIRWFEMVGSVFAVRVGWFGLEPLVGVS